MKIAAAPSKAFDFLRPAVGVNHRSNSGNFVQAFLQQQRAGAEFMIAGAVAWPAGDEDDLLVRGEGSGGESNDAEPNQKWRAEQSGTGVPHSMTLPRIRIRIR